MTTEQLQRKCYSVDNQKINCDSLSELIYDHELQVGATYLEADAVAMNHADSIVVSGIHEDMDVRLSDEVVENESRCANCGMLASMAATCISEYPEEGEWFCSERCQDQHSELDCPHLTHDGYRHPTESQRLIECEAALRRLASWLGVGGYNEPQVDAKVFEQKIRYVVQRLHSPMQAEEPQTQIDSENLPITTFTSE